MPAPLSRSAHPPSTVCWRARGTRLTPPCPQFQLLQDGILSYKWARLPASPAVLPTQPAVSTHKCAGSSTPSWQMARSSPCWPVASRSATPQRRPWRPMRGSASCPSWWTSLTGPPSASRWAHPGLLPGAHALQMGGVCGGQPLAGTPRCSSDSLRGPSQRLCRWAPPLAPSRGAPRWTGRPRRWPRRCWVTSAPLCLLAVRSSVSPQGLGLAEQTG